jgi:thiol-disulfide isomerase/thioredoxin
MKKLLSTMLFVLFALAGQAQTFKPVMGDSIDYVITGTTTSPYDTVAVFPCAPHGATEYFRVTNGQFKVTGRQPRNSFVQIGDYAGNDLRFIVEETPTYINLVTGEVKGSDVQQRFINTQLRMRRIDQLLDPWFEGLSQAEQQRLLTMTREGLSDATKNDSTNLKKLEGFEADAKEALLQNLHENKDNVIPAWYLYAYYHKLSFEEMQAFLRDDAPYAHHPAMEHAWNTYWGKLKKKNLTEKQAPDFEAEAPDGTMHRLSEYLGRGQYVLIDFWASWCGPCVSSFPFMKELHATYKDRVFFLGVSCDKNREAWLKALEKYQLPWTSLCSPARKGNALDLYGVSGIPAVMLITPDGKLISSELEGKALKEKLEEIFKDK